MPFRYAQRKVKIDRDIDRDEDSDMDRDIGRDLEREIGGDIVSQIDVNATALKTKWFAI